MSYAQTHRKDFIDVTQVKEKNREGIFQNWDAQKWEYWEGGEKVGDVAFASIPSQSALDAWLGSLEEAQNGAQ